MSNDITQRLKRKLSTKRQLAVPKVFCEDVDAYMIESESTDEEGNPILTLYPITEDSEM